MNAWFRRAAGAWPALVAVLWSCGMGGAFAARPLLDQHQFDTYFAMYARDVNVPWKTTTVRLDTYSDAPVDFAAYNVDPADVIIAGQNRTPRAIDTSKRKPLMRWRFVPPGGNSFQSNDVDVPLGSQEGFYVVEARRGDAVQQVWINRTHIGLVTKESPEGLVIWGVDLRSGRSLARMSVQFLVGLDLVTKTTDGNGLITFPGRSRPAFALAADGAGRAFISILPQAPEPPGVVGLRVDSAVVRAGERVRFIGFARRRVSGVFKRESGDARVTLAGHGTTLAATSVRLDGSGAFAGELAVPVSVDAGDYALLSTAGGIVGGTTVHVDAASDLSLGIRSLCPCDPAHDVPLAIVARRGGVPAPGISINVEVVRSPHVYPPGAADDAPRWGTTVVLTQTVRTDATGTGSLTIPSPSDGLDSTYGIRAATRGASATTRVVVPNGKLALAIEPDVPTADVGQPLSFELRGFDSGDGTPIGGINVKVRLTHGASSQEQTVALDPRGLGHAVFRESSLGTDLALVEGTYLGANALDAAQISVAPTALNGRSPSAASQAVGVTLDRPRYKPGDTVSARGSASGASGDALFTLEGLRTYGMRRAPVSGGTAQAALALGDAQGAVRVGAAFVRDGAIALGSADVSVDGPGHARLTDLALDKPSYAAGEAMRLTVRDGDVRGGATIAVRVADGRESGAALFEDAPGLLASGATQSQATASDDPEYHAYVAPAKSTANDIFAAERGRRAAVETPTLGAAAPRTLLWKVQRAETPLVIVAPKERGHYVLSIIKIADDGDVGAASTGFNVQ